MENQEIALAITKIIFPYYKGLPSGGDQPEFRKSLSSEEVESLFNGLHNLVVEIRTGETVAIPN